MGKCETRKCVCEVRLLLYALYFRHNFNILQIRNLKQCEKFVCSFAYFHSVVRYRRAAITDQKNANRRDYTWTWMKTRHVIFFFSAFCSQKDKNVLNDATLVLAHLCRLVCSVRVSSLRSSLSLAIVLLASFSVNSSIAANTFNIDPSVATSKTTLKFQRRSMKVRER